jgi:positive regulator of sigma E activity
MANIRKNLTGSRLLAWVTTVMGFILGFYMAYRGAYNEGSFTFLGACGAASALYANKQYQTRKEHELNKPKDGEKL